MGGGHVRRASEASDDLVAIVDHNDLQIDGCIDDVCDPGDLGAKFAAFGWDVQRVLTGTTSPRCVERFRPRQGRRGRYGPPECA